MKSAVLLVFARQPVPGQVKTRLCPPLTEVEAARVHEICLQAVMTGVLQIADVDTVLVGTPDSSEPAFRRLIGEKLSCVWDQGHGTLGQRLERATRKALDAGATRVLVIGTDSPQMPTSCIQSAVQRLDHADVVLGPTKDGGYYLIGLRRDPDCLFQTIDWGTEHVAEQTRARIRAQGWALSELPESYDIDEIADLSRAANAPPGRFLSRDAIDQLRQIAVTAESRPQDF